MLTRSGHAVGILLNSWSPLLPDTAEADGLPRLAVSALGHNHDIQRIVLITGPAVRSRRLACDSFTEEPVEEIFLPAFLAFDITVVAKGGLHSVTALQCPLDDEKSYQGVFLDGKDTGRNWEILPELMGRLGMAEIWSRLSGDVRPSWGILMRDGLWVAEAPAHIGVIRSEHALPDKADATDTGRIEQLLSNVGAPIGGSLERGVRLPEILERLQMLENARDFESWLDVVRAIRQDREEGSSGNA